MGYQDLRTLCRVLLEEFEFEYSSEGLVDVSSTPRTRARLRREASRARGDSND